MSQFTEDNITFIGVTDPTFFERKRKKLVRKCSPVKVQLYVNFFFESVVDFSKAFLFLDLLA